jgi:hypothetical protein
VEKLKQGKGKAARDETEGKKEKCVWGGGKPNAGKKIA